MHRKERFANVIFDASLQPKNAAIAILLMLLVLIFILLFLFVTVRAQSFACRVARAALTIVRL